MDPMTLAGAAVAALAPYLVELGKGAAKELGAGPAKAVWEWVKGKMTSASGKEAVAEIEQAPADALSKTALTAALARMLRDDPAAVGELSRLLEQAGVRTGDQTMNIKGDNSTGVQAAGANINIKLGR